MSDRASAPFALCGLGHMGEAIASRLSRLSVLGYDADVEKGRRVCERHGLTHCESLDELAAARTVLLCLPAPSISQSVVTTLAPLMPEGSVIVETSTVNPTDVAALVETAAPHGVGVVDAAIAAGVGQMRAGTAALLVGGADDDVERARALLEAFSGRVVRLGPSGSGAALKVINNAVAHAVMVVLVEAAAMAEAAGVPRRNLIELMTGNDAGLTRPLEHRLMERIAAGDYEGGMPTDAARKDSTLALSMAQSLNVPLFAIQASHIVYELAVADGYGRMDYASIAKLWESWLGTSLSDPTEPSL